jgi:hypothetical protein
MKRSPPIANEIIAKAAVSKVMEIIIAGIVKKPLLIEAAHKSMS